MTAAVLPVQRDLAGLFRAALERAAASGALALDPAAIGEPALERPRLPEHGRLVARTPASFADGRALWPAR